MPAQVHNQLQTAHSQAVAQGINGAVVAFDALAVAVGVNAIRAACEARRTWLHALLGAGNFPAAWAHDLALAFAHLPQGQRAPSAMQELAIPFAQFAWPALVTVILAANPAAHQLAPACPMGTLPGAPLLVVAPSLVAPHGLTCGLTIDQIVFHEAIHLCGDTLGDTIPRMNWAGVGAISRLSRGLPVAVVDQLAICG
jgi:hypothetical protein